MLLPINVGNTRIVGSDNHVEYEVKVGGQARCWRRYREFDDLAKALKKNSVAPTAPFPPKRMFGNNSPEVIEERVSGLEAWLVAAVKLVPRKSPTVELVSDFLTVNPWIEEAQSSGQSGQQSGSASSRPKSKSELKLKEVVNRFASAASAPSQYSSLSKLNSASKIKEEPTSEAPSADLTEFRRALEKAENIFAVIRAGKN